MGVTIEDFMKNVAYTLLNPLPFDDHPTFDTLMGLGKLAGWCTAFQPEDSPTAEQARSYLSALLR